jgi:hypothetical protein
MARVRVCKFCGHKNAADEHFCQGRNGSETCGVSIAGFPLVDESEVQASLADAGGCASGFYGTVREFPKYIQDEQAHLECTWGVLSIVGSLSIGRDAGFCPEAERFSSYMTVSGVHARISCTDEKWSVRDLGSTNGTYLNGIQITTNEGFILSDGDQVHFSKSFRAIFRVGVAGG